MSRPEWTLPMRADSGHRQHSGMGPYRRQGGLFHLGSTRAHSSKPDRYLSGEGSGGGRAKFFEPESRLHHTCAPSLVPPLPSATSTSNPGEAAGASAAFRWEHHGIPHTAREREDAGDMWRASHFCELHLAKLLSLWMFLTPSFPENFRTDVMFCDCA